MVLSNMVSHQPVLHMEKPKPCCQATVMAPVLQSKDESPMLVIWPQIEGFFSPYSALNLLDVC